MRHFAHINDTVATRTTTLNNTPTYRRSRAAKLVGIGRVETVYDTVVVVGCNVLNVCAGGAVSSCRYLRIVTAKSWLMEVKCSRLGRLVTCDVHPPCTSSRNKLSVVYIILRNFNKHKHHFQHKLFQHLQDHPKSVPAYYTRLRRHGYSLTTT